MAAVHPGVSLTPSHFRRTSVRQPHDTPTPAPSSAHNSAIITSLKPTRSRTNLAADAQKSQQYLYSTGTTRPSTQMPLEQSMGRQTNVDHAQRTDDALNHLEIATDATERERRTLEREIRDGFGDLAGERSPSSNDSLGYGGLSDVEEGSEVGVGPAGNFRGRMGDESPEDSSESLSDDFSLRIGMTGTRTSQEHGSQTLRGPHPPSTGTDGPNLQRNIGQPIMEEEDITFLTISRSVSPSSPRENLQPRIPTAVPKPSSMMPRGLSKEFYRAQAQPPSKSNAENIQPNQFNHAAGASAAAATTTSFGTINPPKFSSYPHKPVPFATSSPFNHAVASNGLRGPPAASKSMGHSNNLARPTTSAQSLHRESNDNVHEGSAVYLNLKLPDVTGLTEGLQSPIKSRGHRSVPHVEVGKSEGAAIVEAVAAQQRVAAQQKREILGLRNALAAREEEMERLRMQEEQAEDDDDEDVRGRQHGDVHQQDHQYQRYTSEDDEGLHRPFESDSENPDWRRRLQKETAKRQGLEAQVHRLDVELSKVNRLLFELRAEPVTTQTTTRREDSPWKLELRTIRHDLDDLGKQVLEVKMVIEELLREKEITTGWEREEEERRRNLQAAKTRATMSKGAEKGPTKKRASFDKTGDGKHAIPEHEHRRSTEDPDQTPRAHEKRYSNANERRWTIPDTPQSDRVISKDEEITRLQAELAREEARRSPTPNGRGRHHHLPAHFSEIPSRATGTESQRQRPSTQPSAGFETDRIRPTSFATRGGVHREDPGKDDDADMQENYARAEQIFKAMQELKLGGESSLCSQCKKRRSEKQSSAPPRMESGRYRGGSGEGEEDEGYRGETEEEVKEKFERCQKQPQRQRQQQQQNLYREKQKKVEARLALLQVWKDLEADFDTHKRIFIELSEQYRSMGSRVSATKRHALADHLKESIDTLELKADQVKRFHDLLH